MRTGSREAVRIFQMKLAGWQKRRNKLDAMFRESRKLLGVYASWQNLLNHPPVISFDPDIQRRADAERARIQSKADAVYAEYKRKCAEIEKFVNTPEPLKYHQITFPV